MAAVLVKDGQKFILAAMVSGLPWLPTIGLFTGPLNPTPDTVLADIVEATFPGYARRVLPVWLPPIINPFGAAVMTAPPVSWTTTGPSPTSPTTGYFLIQQDALHVTHLLVVERFNRNVPTWRSPVTLSVTVPFTLGSFF